MKLKSVRNPKKADVWVTEINVKEMNDRKASKTLDKIVKLVRKYESLS
jgi:hypothetical protein